VSAFSKSFALLLLDTSLTFADIEKFREGAVDISKDHVPWFGVEHRVALRNFSNYNPMLELFNFRILFVSVLRCSWSSFESNWTHIVVIAVINISFFLVLQSFGKFVKGLIRIYVMSGILSVSLKADTGFSMLAKIFIQKAEPLN
jgi:hypothetical protein